MGETLTSEGAIAVEYTVVTDGACSGNPGPGGWCALIVGGTGAAIRGPFRVSGLEPATTNNRMELRAVLEGITRLPAGATVTVFTDSQYVVGTLSQGWKRRANHDLLTRIDAELARRQVRFQWVSDLADHDDPDRRAVHGEACAMAQRARSQVQGQGATITLDPGQLALVQDLVREWAAAVMADPRSEDDLRSGERLLATLGITD